MNRKTDPRRFDLEIDAKNVSMNNGTITKRMTVEELILFADRLQLFLHTLIGKKYKPYFPVNEDVVNISEFKSGKSVTVKIMKRKENKLT